MPDADPREPCTPAVIGGKGGPWPPPEDDDKARVAVAPPPPPLQATHKPRVRLPLRTRMGGGPHGAADTSTLRAGPKEALIVDEI